MASWLVKSEKGGGTTPLGNMSSFLLGGLLLTRGLVSDGLAPPWWEKEGDWSLLESGNLEGVVAEEGEFLSFFWHWTLSEITWVRVAWKETLIFQHHGNGDGHPHHHLLCNRYCHCLCLRHCDLNHHLHKYLNITREQGQSEYWALILLRKRAWIRRGDDRWPKLELHRPLFGEVVIWEWSR